MSKELQNGPGMQSPAGPEGDGLTDAARLEAVLRDLIWRVEHVRLLLQRPTASSTPEDLAALLDTSHARQALRLDGAQLSGDGRAASEIMRRMG